MSKAPRPEAPTFQEIILRLQRYWADNGCVVMQPYDNEVGAGTFAHGHHAALAGPRRLAFALCRSRAADRLTAAMAKTRTACSTTTSSRCS